MIDRNRLIESPAAPEIAAERWLNTPAALTLAGLRGRIVALHAFQMLCPGCVLHGVPQAQRLHERFDAGDLQVIGLHSVFEHHAAMGQASLDAFVHEFRISFPVAVDQHEAPDPLPVTMRRYAMRGTPTLVLIDRAGRIRDHFFGQVDDLAVGVALGRLLAERS